MSIHWQQQGTHVGIAVYSISKAKTFYHDILGLTWLKEEKVLNQGVNVAFLQAGSIVIELIEPLHANHTIARFLQKYGEGIHHLALGVKDLKETVSQLENKNATFLSSAIEKGAGETDIIFLSPKHSHGVLLELCEKENI